MEFFTGCRDALCVAGIYDIDDCLCVWVVASPVWPNAGLSAQVPNLKLDILVRYSLNVETDSWINNHDILSAPWRKSGAGIKWTWDRDHKTIARGLMPTHLGLLTQPHQLEDGLAGREYKVNLASHGLLISSHTLMKTMLSRLQTGDICPISWRSTTLEAFRGG